MNAIVRVSFVPVPPLGVEAEGRACPVCHMPLSSGGYFSLQCLTYVEGQLLGCGRVFNTES